MKTLFQFALASLLSAWGAASFTGVVAAGEMPDPSALLSGKVAPPKHAAQASAPSAQHGELEVAFSPGGAEGLVLREITGARTSIDLAAYSFTSTSVAKALVDAHKRGVRVRAVLDKSQLSERYTGATFLANAGIEVRINSRYAIMHNKFMVLDGVAVQTGSFNYTKAAAEKNAENIVVIRNNDAVASAYAKEWQRLWNESEPLAARY